MVHIPSKQSKYLVYTHIFPNDKVYIGITSQKPNERWKNGKGYYGSTRIHNAIQKHGWENIQHEILYENLTKEEAEKKEKELIQKYKSYDDKYGYNLELGGNLNKEISEETRKKLSKKLSGKNNPMYGKHMSEENKKIWEIFRPSRRKQPFAPRCMIMSRNSIRPASVEIVLKIPSKRTDSTTIITTEMTVRITFFMLCSDPSIIYPSALHNASSGNHR